MKKIGFLRFTRSSDGTVTAEIINADGQVQDTRNFGVFSESEYHILFRAIREHMPDVEVIEVEVTDSYRLVRCQSVYGLLRCH
jgi:hypothetical protein